MSVEVMSIVWQKSTHKGIYLLLMLALADHAGEPDGTSIFPSVKTLAMKTRSAERTVQRMLRKLEASGEISTVIKGHDIGGGNFTNEYAINIDQLEDESKEHIVRRKKKKDEGGVKSDTTGGRQKWHQGGDSIDTTVVTKLRHQGGDRAVSPNPSSYPSEDPSEEKREQTAVAAHAPFQDSESIIKSWCLKESVEKVCIWFSNFSGVSVTQHDRARWVKGAITIASQQPTERDIYKAVELAREKKYHYTQPGGIYEFLKEVMVKPKVITVIPTYEIITEEELIRRGLA